MKNEKSTTPNLGQPAVKPSNRPTNAENVTKSAKHDSNQKRKAIVTKKSNSSAEVNSKYSLVIIAIAIASVQRISQVVNWVRVTITKCTKQTIVVVVNLKYCS